MNTKLIAGSLLLIIILLGSPVSSRPNYMSAFMEEYDVTDTRLATCDMCHVNPNGGGVRDSYGLDYAENGKDFATIEELDSDGDGFTNIEEINALTFPSDADDYPDIIEVTETKTIDAENSSIDAESETETTVNNETSTETGSDSNVETTTTEVQSPGFGIILAVFGMIGAFYINGKT